MARDFPVTTEAAEGGSRQVVIVSCGTCDVRAVLSAHWQGPDRTDQISRHLRKRGWLMGKRPTGDRCPDCARLHRRYVRNDPECGVRFSSQDAFNRAIEQAIDRGDETDPAGVANDSRIIMDMKSKSRTKTMDVSADPAPAADPPAAPDRESRRLIHAEIDVVWLDDRKGYAGGATDRSIAEKLGVPVAWVAEVREFAFGPCMINEDLEAFRAELASATEQMAAVQAEQEALSRQVEAAKSALAALARRAEPLLKAVRP